MGKEERGRKDEVNNNNKRTEAALNTIGLSQSSLFRGKKP